MRRILVTLVSSQTIPNVQFIKEKKADHHLFVATPETKELQNWIMNACELDQEQVTSISILPFSYKNIYGTLKNLLEQNAIYIVNLTGGTKIMSLAVNDLFRTVPAELFYLTGKNNYIQIYPEKSESEFLLQSSISLKDYLVACGFIVSQSPYPQFPLSTSEKIFTYFLSNFNKDTDAIALQFLRNHRSKNITDITICTELPSFLVRIGYQPLDGLKLSKREIKYLTGDWFEEYLFFKIQAFTNLQQDAIGTGVVITKQNVQNEFDVMVVKDGVLHIFECKTSIWLDFDETKNIIVETIYKADSLRNKLGLFAKTSIVTLSDLSNSKIKQHLLRANENGIKVIGKENFMDLDSTLKNLF
jgi:hypothetical protein